VWPRLRHSWDGRGSLHRCSPAQPSGRCPCGLWGRGRRQSARSAARRPERDAPPTRRRTLLSAPRRPSFSLESSRARGPGPAGLASPVLVPVLVAVGGTRAALPASRSPSSRALLAGQPARGRPHCYGAGDRGRAPALFTDSGMLAAPELGRSQSARRGGSRKTMREETGAKHTSSPTDTDVRRGRPSRSSGAATLSARSPCSGGPHRDGRPARGRSPRELDREAFLECGQGAPTDRWRSTASSTAGWTRSRVVGESRRDRTRALAQIRQARLAGLLTFAGSVHRGSGRNWKADVAVAAADRRSRLGQPGTRRPRAHPRRAVRGPPRGEVDAAELTMIDQRRAGCLRTRALHADRGP
jgi:hypothetical protein